MKDNSLFSMKEGMHLVLF